MTLPWGLVGVQPDRFGADRHQPAAGAQLHLHLDQLCDLINEWLDLADDYLRSWNDSRPMITVQDSGTELASQSHASVRWFRNLR